jgi:hypothetical protein
MPNKITNIDQQLPFQMRHLFSIVIWTSSPMGIKTNNWDTKKAWSQLELVGSISLLPGVVQQSS